MSTDLVLRHGGRSANNDDVVSGSFIVGRIFRPSAGAPQAKPWVWSIFEHRKRGHDEAFAEAWR
jgi:hypothetical protein